MNERPLQYKRILVTRAKEQATEFSMLIEERGGTAIEVPLLSFQATNKSEEIHQIMKYIHTYTWIIFTSTNGVKFFFSLLEKEKINATSILSQLRVAVVGKKTEAALREIGFEADIVPKYFVAEGLFEELKRFIQKGERVLFPKGNLARDILPSQLNALGISVTELTVYENRQNVAVKDKLIRLIKQQELDVLTFTSTSAVNYFMDIVSEAQLVPLLKNFKIACIGPIATATANSHGLSVNIIASPYTIEGLVEAISMYYLKEEAK